MMFNRQQWQAFRHRLQGFCRDAAAFVRTLCSSCLPNSRQAGSSSASTELQEPLLREDKTGQQVFAADGRYAHCIQDSDDEDDAVVRGAATVAAAFEQRQDGTEQSGAGSRGASSEGHADFSGLQLTTTQQTTRMG